MEIKMGECKIEGCYEIAEILLSERRMDWLLKEGEEFPHLAARNFAELYMHFPRPSTEDVVGAKLSKQGGWWCVTMKIRRGKEVLAMFFNKHGGVSVGEHESGEGLQLWCSCGAKLDVPWESLGHLGGRIVWEATQACNAQTIIGEGSIQRTVDTDISRPVEERED